VFGMYRWLMMWASKREREGLLGEAMDRASVVSETLFT
jgi:hypothetical protein